MKFYMVTFHSKRDLNTTQTSFLHHLKVSTALNSITSEVTEAEWTGKTKVWKETTTTSPSGMHLGHHKALLMDLSSVDTTSPPRKLTMDAKRKLLLQGQLALLDAIHHSFSYERWHKVATIMIQKDPQSSKIHQLRVIHLY
jgi:hypothetical protein